MEPGELIIAIGIVVIFAYLLGAVAFLLDLVYLVVDPRIRLLPYLNEMQLNVKSKKGCVATKIKSWLKGKPKDQMIFIKGSAMRKKRTVLQIIGDLKRSLLESNDVTRLFFQELRRYPSAIFGLSVISILFAGSI